VKKQEQNQPILTKPGKSKEELLAIRKAMLKPRTMTPSATESSAAKNSSNFTSIDSKGPKPELMSRLANGKRADVNKKEMYKLTHKNYDQLPEVKKKKEEEEKKGQFKNRMR